MTTNCTEDLSDVFSPLSRSYCSNTRESYGESSTQTQTTSTQSFPNASSISHNRSAATPRRLRPPVAVADHFFFHYMLYRFQRMLANAVRRLPMWFRLGLEFTLLASTLGGVVTLVTLHALVMPSPFAPHTASALIAPLASALQQSPVVVELLRVDVELPAPRWTWSNGVSQMPKATSSRVVRCEFAAERASLDLPARARARAYLARGGHALALSLPAPATRDGHGFERQWPSPWPAVLLSWIPGLPAALVERQILAAIVWGPFYEEVKHKQAAVNSTGAATDGNLKSSFAQQQQRRDSSAESFPSAAMEGLTLLGWAGIAYPTGIESAKGGTEQLGSSALAYVSCRGQRSIAVHALRLTAELLHRSAEWWLFKVVWVSSIAVVTLIVGVGNGLAVRSTMLSIFHLHMFCVSVKRRTSPAHHLEALEAIVITASLGAFAFVICQIAGDAKADVAIVLFCQILGEVGASCILRSEESRYIFPRAVLPVYVADIFYTFFHPFGFTWLSHLLLFLFQQFIIMVLWNHFEVTLKLPATCPDQMLVHVRLQPSEQRVRQHHALVLSPGMQQLLLEQGVLLLGRDRLYENAIVMSAIIMRALQVASLPPIMKPVFSVTMPQDIAALLAGGVSTQMLVAYARIGDTRCLAFVGQLVGRLQRGPSITPLVTRDLANGSAAAASTTTTPLRPDHGSCSSSSSACPSSITCDEKPRRGSSPSSIRSSDSISDYSSRASAASCPPSSRFFLSALADAHESRSCLRRIVARDGNLSMRRGRSMSTPGIRGH
eukprot:TRINITY_DN50444_c0_g1_i1.p1 TRINITY_DN50444_c0_g1~~TRINITY_DN50444_c0_g1_i1.p1  ORF type:complete len:796 (+),score=91.42 TRINITY_DN50444_c0_g1_i1:53-2389(+)